MKTILIYVVTFILFTSSCISENIIDVNNLENGSISFSLDKKNAPEDVVEVIVYLTRQEFETKVQSMNLLNDKSANILINDIKIGLWHLAVEALDINRKLLYSGETDIEVKANTIVPVNLQLNPSTGSIDLTVTWGGTNKKEMVAFYPFSGNANDKSGLRNNGFVNGATLTLDRFGNNNSAYYFDGIDDYIRIPDNNSLTPTNQKMTIIAWVKNEGSRNKAILYKGDKYNNREYAVGINENALAGFSINNHGMWQENQIGLGSIVKIKDNQWSFFTATWDGNQMNIYVNGQLENSKITNAKIGNFDSDLFVGVYGGEIERYAFKGVIDDIRIYNYVISEEKIKELYHEKGWVGIPEWVDYSSNPLVSGNDDYPNAMHSVIFKNKNLYGMYFSGHSSQGADIYLAMSFDGLTWEKHGNAPVLKRGEAGSWDDRNIGAGPIIRKNNKFFMYYSGRSSAEYVSSAWHIGIATSNNGIEWEKYPSPIISGDKNSWDLKIGASDIKIINGIYYLYYTGKTELNDHQIGLATSSDGINWKKYKNNPIMKPTESWEGSGIYYPTIIEENNKYKMVYQNSYNNYITGFGMAYSTDGINWVKETNNPIFTETDTKNNYSMILYPNFQKTENEYRIYYTGKNPSTGRSSINVTVKKF